MKSKTAVVSSTQARAKVVIALFAFALVAGAIVWAATTPARAFSGPVYTVDFTDYRSGPVDAWLRAKGFAFERDAKNPNSIAFRADARGLEVSALRQAQGLLVNNAINPNAYSIVEIEWGVAQHPQGASYEHQINNEAIMVHVFFGKEKKPSGSAFAPDIPYFIGLFLCNGDRIGHAYVGRYYQEGGRYVCLGTPQPGQSVFSRFNLKEGVRSIFGARAAEAVTGYSIAVDTSNSAGQGRSSAFIKQIRFVG